MTLQLLNHTTFQGLSGSGSSAVYLVLTREKIQ